MDYLTMQIRAIYDIKVHNVRLRLLNIAARGTNPPVPIQRGYCFQAFLSYLWQDDVAGVAFVFFFGQLDLVQIGIEHGSLREERLSEML